PRLAPPAPRSGSLAGSVGRGQPQRPSRPTGAPGQRGLHHRAAGATVLAQRSQRSVPALRLHAPRGARSARDRGGRGAADGGLRADEPRAQSSVTGTPARPPPSPPRLLRGCHADRGGGSRENVGNASDLSRRLPGPALPASAWPFAPRLSRRPRPPGNGSPGASGGGGDRGGGRRGGGARFL